MECDGRYKGALFITDREAFFFTTDINFASQYGSNIYIKIINTQERFKTHKEI